MDFIKAIPLDNRGSSNDDIGLHNDYRGPPDNYRPPNDYRKPPNDYSRPFGGGSHNYDPNKKPEKERIFCDTITNYVKSMILDLASNAAAKNKQLKNNTSIFRKKLDEMLNDLNELKEKGPANADKNNFNILKDLSALEVNLHIIIFL